MEKLPTEVKQKWVAALRSGEWTQGRGELNDGCGGYCCLGVLAEVLEPGVTKEGGQLCTMASLREHLMDNSPYASTFVHRHNLQALYCDNHSLKQLADEFRSGAAANVADPHVDTSLMCLNDDGRYSFEQLAELIEEYL